MKTLKIRDETHVELTKVLGELTAQTGQVKTYDEAILALVRSRSPSIIMASKRRILESANLITEIIHRFRQNGKGHLEGKDALQIKKEANEMIDSLSTIGEYVDANGKRVILQHMSGASISLLHKFNVYDLAFVEGWAKASCMIPIMVDLTTKQPFKFFGELSLWNTVKAKLMGERK